VVLQQHPARLEARCPMGIVEGTTKRRDSGIVNIMMFFFGFFFLHQPLFSTPQYFLFFVLKGKDTFANIPNTHLPFRVRKAGSTQVPEPLPEHLKYNDKVGCLCPTKYMFKKKKRNNFGRCKGETAREVCAREKKSSSSCCLLFPMNFFLDHFVFFFPYFVLEKTHTCRHTINHSINLIPLGAKNV
jgi:hypothetical protein